MLSQKIEENIILYFLLLHYFFGHHLEYIYLLSFQMLIPVVMLHIWKDALVNNYTWL